MTDRSDSPILPQVEEGDASPDVMAVYNEAKRFTQSPDIPNFFKSTALWAPGVELLLEMLKTYYAKSTIPMTLTAIIQYVIATDADCEYCAVGNEISCRMAGIDDETLTLLAENLDDVSPDRLRDIVTFALKTAKRPRDLVAADYDVLRSHGLGDDEIVQIVMVSAYAVFNDILADGLKMPVEEPKWEVLEQLKGG
jgi:alkylhydroperoxidase family enzyme